MCFFKRKNVFKEVERVDAEITARDNRFNKEKAMAYCTRCGGILLVETDTVFINKDEYHRVCALKEAYRKIPIKEVPNGNPSSGERSDHPGVPTK